MKLYTDTGLTNSEIDSNFREIAKVAEGGKGVRVFATQSDLPFQPSGRFIAFVEETKNFYIYNGQGYFSLGEFTDPDATAESDLPIISVDDTLTVTVTTAVPVAPSYLRTPTTTVGGGVSFTENCSNHVDTLLVTNYCWRVDNGKYLKWGTSNVRFGSTSSSDSRVIFAIRYLSTSSARIGASFRDQNGNYHIIHAYNGVGGNYSTASSWRSLGLSNNTWYIMTPRNANTGTNAWLIHDINTNSTFLRSYSGSSGYALAYSNGIGDMWFFGGNVPDLDGYSSRGNWEVEVGALGLYPASFDEYDVVDDFKERVFD